MGSFEEEEEELGQMVIDFLEPEPHSSPSSSSSSISTKPLSLTYCALQEMLQSSREEEREVLEKVNTYLTSQISETTNLKKWVVMRLKKDGLEASLCKSSWVTSFGCPKFTHSGHPKGVKYVGCYEYMDVMVKEKRVIVDLDFRSQFEVARPSGEYRELVECLPLVFVGNEEKLGEIISLMCLASKESLKKNGLFVPPWRKAAYMLSKWLSKDCTKVSDDSWQF